MEENKLADSLACSPLSFEDLNVTFETNNQKIKKQFIDRLNNQKLTSINIPYKLYVAGKYFIRLKDDLINIVKDGSNFVLTCELEIIENHTFKNIMTFQSFKLEGSLDSIHSYIDNIDERIRIAAIELVANYYNMEAVVWRELVFNTMEGVKLRYNVALTKGGNFEQQGILSRQLLAMLLDKSIEFIKENKED